MKWLNSDYTVLVLVALLIVSAIAFRWEALQGAATVGLAVSICMLPFFLINDDATWI